MLFSTRRIKRVGLPAPPPHRQAMSLLGSYLTLTMSGAKSSTSLVCERSAEERHDAVASHFVHRAFVVMDRFHHPLDHRVEELAGLLGIAVGKQLHGALEVGEQHRDLLAF